MATIFGDVLYIPKSWDIYASPSSNLPQHQAEAEAQLAAHLGHLGTRGDQGPQQGAAEDRHEETGLCRQDLGSHGKPWGMPMI